jgi:hypothetical protein
VQQGRESTVRLLLRLGADRNVCDKHNKRPSDYAQTEALRATFQ